MRERRQPAAVARHQSRARNFRARRARRLALARHPAAADGERAAVGDRRPRGTRHRDDRHPPVRSRHGGRRTAVLDSVHDGRQRVRVLRARLPRHRHHLRPRAGAARLEDRRERDPEGRRPQRHRRRARAPLDRRADGRRAHAHRRAARRRRLHDAQLRHDVPARPGRRHVEAADDGAGAARSQIPGARTAPGLLRAARGTAEVEPEDRERHDHQQHSAAGRLPAQAGRSTASRSIQGSRRRTSRC